MIVRLPLFAAAAAGVQVGAAIVASRYVVAEVRPLTLTLLRFALGPFKPPRGKGYVARVPDGLLVVPGDLIDDPVPVGFGQCSPDNAIRSLCRCHEREPAQSANAGRQARAMALKSAS